jgi:hypothetical protein
LSFISGKGDGLSGTDHSSPSGRLSFVHDPKRQKKRHKAQGTRLKGRLKARGARLKAQGSRLKARGARLKEGSLVFIMLAFILIPKVKNLIKIRQQ